jgi:hypothetical protein
MNAGEASGSDVDMEFCATMSRFPAILTVPIAGDRRRPWRAAMSFCFWPIVACNMNETFPLIHFRGAFVSYVKS